MFILFDQELEELGWVEMDWYNQTVFKLKAKGMLSVVPQYKILVITTTINHQNHKYKIC